MSQSELVKKVVSILDKIGIEYMITGSFVSSLQGIPRLSHDTDIVVLITKINGKKLASEFPLPHYYLDEDSILSAIEHRSVFNLLDTQNGDKVDFWILSEEPFDKSRFSRKYAEEFLGVKVHVSTPEDTILAKLRWSELSGGSEKQMIDAINIYKIQSGKLDLEYIDRWVKQFQIEPLWKLLINKATE